MARVAKAIESPRRCRLSNLPRSIAWKQVEQMLQKVDRTTAVGKRDYAILLLLVTYRQRAREVGALMLAKGAYRRPVRAAPEARRAAARSRPLGARAAVNGLGNARETLVNEAFWGPSFRQLFCIL